MIGIFVGLLALHVWLLYRMVSTANGLVAGLLLVAIALFGWRLVHYANVYRGVAGRKVTMEPSGERRQIRIMGPTLAALLAIHAWLVSLVLAWAPSTERSLFLVLLLLAVVVFAARLAFYARRYALLRRAS